MWTIIMDTSNDQTMFFTDCTDYFLAMQWNSQADADYQMHHLARSGKRGVAAGHIRSGEPWQSVTAPRKAPIRAGASAGLAAS